MRKDELTPEQLTRIRSDLTLIPNRMNFGSAAPVDGEEGEEVPADKPLSLYAENDEWIGLAREFFLARRQPHHEVELRCTYGDKSTWPGPLQWNPAFVPRPEQEEATQAFLAAFRAGTLGALLRAKPGWGKTLFSLYLASKMQLPTLIVVHKEFLAEQWLERIHGNPRKDIKPALLNAKVGVAQEDRCEFRGNHIVIGMVHSLAKKSYPRQFYDWPGLVITDECHRIGAATWSVVPPKFRARFRLGVTATPRRKDGCERVFKDHIGPILFTATETRLAFKVRRVWTEYRLPKSDRVNTGLAGKPLVLTFMCANRPRNLVIVGELLQAIQKGRKIIVLSERLDHLERLNNLLIESWPSSAGSVPTTGKYVGGMTSEEREDSERKQVIFATYQYAAEGLDIPALDTAFLASPYSDVEQAVGRIGRPHPGKKDPVVVDFRDDNVGMFHRAGLTRERFYRKSGVVL